MIFSAIFGLNHDCPVKKNNQEKGYKSWEDFEKFEFGILIIIIFSALFELNHNNKVNLREKPRKGIWNLKVLNAFI